MAKTYCIDRRKAYESLYIESFRISFLQLIFLSANPNQIRLKKIFAGAVL